MRKACLCAGLPFCLMFVFSCSCCYFFLCTNILRTVYNALATKGVSQNYYKNDIHSLNTVDDGARQVLSIGGILNDARKKRIAYSKPIHQCAIRNAQ